MTKSCVIQAGGKDPGIGTTKGRVRDPERRRKSDPDYNQQQWEGSGEASRITSKYSEIGYSRFRLIALSDRL